MAHPREAELLQSLPPAAATAMRQVLSDPELDRWVRMPTQQTLWAALSAVGWQRRRFVPAGELPAAQRAVLEICAFRPELDPAAPGPRWSIRRWLGIDPPGAIERVTPVKLDGKVVEAPLWRAFDAARGDPPGVLRVLESLPLPDRLAAFGELDAGAYELRPNDLPAEFPGLESLRDEGREWAPAHADWLLEQATDPRRPYNVKAQIAIRPPLFLSLVRSNTPVERRWEVFLPVTGAPAIFRECLDALPQERRVPAIRAALPTSGPEQALAILAPLIEQHRWPGLVDLAFERHLGFYPPKKETLAKLDALTRGDSALAAAFAENKKRKPLKLVVEARDRPAADDLSPLQKEQLAHLDEQQLDVTDFYVLTDPRGAPLYDVLLLAGSDGAVFATGTSKVAALVAQGGADAEDGALCVAIDAAFEAFRTKPPRQSVKKAAKKRR
jgi:hypothetical protein